VELEASAASFIQFAIVAINSSSAAADERSTKPGRTSGEKNPPSFCGFQVRCKEQTLPPGIVARKLLKLVFLGYSNKAGIHLSYPHYAPRSAR
jgi:hypothetical protein